MKRIIYTTFCDVIKGKIPWYFKRLYLRITNILQRVITNSRHDFGAKLSNCDFILSYNLSCKLIFVTVFARFICTVDWFVRFFIFHVVIPLSKKLEWMRTSNVYAKNLSSILNPSCVQCYFYFFLLFLQWMKKKRPLKGREAYIHIYSAFLWCMPTQRKHL